MSKEVMKLALDYIVATNKSSEFWLVPGSNLNKTVTALRLEIDAQNMASEESVVWGVDRAPAQQELDELIAQRDQLADILTRTANALKNEPAELTQHSWHDLPKVAQQLKAAQQEPVTWGVDWGKAGDIPCVSIIKRLPGGGIEVVAVEYAPYTFKEKNT